MAGPRHGAAGSERETARTWTSGLYPRYREALRHHSRNAGASSGAAPARRLQSWSEILADTHLAFDVRDTHRTPGPVRRAVTRRRFGDLVLVDCAASPFFGHRSRALMGGAGEARQPEDILGFQFVYRGVEKVKEGDRELALTAGDVVLWDGLQPTDVEIVEAFHKRTLLFPRDRVLALCPRLGEVSAFPSLNDSGPARLLVRYMNALAAEFPRLDSSASAAAASAALELLRAAIEPSLPASRSVTRPALRVEIRRYVRTHLHDPALSPATIAQGLRDVGAGAARAVRGRRRVGRGAGSRRAADALPGGPAAPQRGLGHRHRVPLGLLRRGALLARVQARVRRHAERDPTRRGRWVRLRRGSRSATPSTTASGRRRSGTRSRSICPLIPLRTSTVREPPMRPSATSMLRSSPITASVSGGQPEMHAELGDRRARRLAQHLAGGRR